MTEPCISLADNVTLTVAAGIVTLYRLDSGVLVQMNPAGSHCLLALLDGEEEDRLVDSVADQLDQPVAEVSASVGQLLAELVTDGWLQRRTESTGMAQL